MDTERRRRIKEVFTTVLDMPPALRTVWLDEALSGDATLAEEVRGLVAAFEGGDEALEPATLAAGPELRRELQTAVEGLRIGPYRILSELGRGGMGAVYLAVRDDEAYEQKVAIKLVKRGMDTDEIVHRFVHERKILAALAHPNIARLLDGGSTPDGRPYFVMEYIEGRRITVFAREEDLSVEAKLRLFVKVCSAVQFAHQNLIVHRDLKPGNILVDRDGEPKLLDFGIAKLLAPPALGGLSELTRAHQRPMTPDYASPEQVEGGVITTASDVYALGILLYELLAGHNPVALAHQVGADWAERSPSQAVLALSGDRRLSRRLRGDLDNVVGKALEREPQRRYATAAALAEDLERHLDRRPVKARRPTVGYRLGRTLVRHKLASAFVMAVVVLAGIAGFMGYRAEMQRRQAELQSRRTKALLGFMDNLLHSADPRKNRGEQVTVNKVVEEVTKQLLKTPEAPPRWSPMADGGPRFDPGTQASLLYKVADINYSLGHYDDSEKLLNRALRLYKPLKDREDKLVEAACQTLLGHVIRDQGRYAESRLHYLKALSMKKQLVGFRDLSRAADLNGLGSVWTELDDLAQAAGYLKDAESIARQAGSPGLKDLAVTLNNQASLADRQKRFGEARQRYQEAFDIERTLLGADDPETLFTERNLGSAIGHLNDYAQAESLYRHVLQAQERVLGADHRELILTLSMLGDVQISRKNYPGAADSFRRALALRQRLGVPHNLDEATVVNNYAYVLQEQGDLRGAEENYQKCRQLYLGLEGDYQSDIERVSRKLSEIRQQRGNSPRR